MGTWYTFATALVRKESDCEKFEKAFREYQKTDKSFEAHKITYGNVWYFVGCIKNSGGGFYEWSEINCPDIDMVWVSDEGDYGSVMK